MTRQLPRRAAIHGTVRSAIRPAGVLLLLAFLAACAATPQSSVPIAQEAADYRSHARAYYAPPGPPDDPWGPYIDEASRRFDVPDGWIRAVMHQESGGHEFINGQFVTSVPGAMGLMQLMPPTYDDMRSQYGLGPDAYDPHDNIMAGTAYIRQMYDIYGSPGFLAAYNTGPGRLDDFLTRNRALPHETRQYVAIIGPQIAGLYPNSRSQADLMVMNHGGSAVEVAAVQSSTETRSVRMAWARRRDHDSGDDQPIQVAEAPAAGGGVPAYQASWTPIAPTRRPAAAQAQVPAHAQAQALAPSRAVVAKRDSGASGNAVASVGAVWAQRLAASPAPAPVAVPAASAPTPSRMLPVQIARAMPAAHDAPPPSRGMPRGRHFRLIEPAMAESPPLLRGGAAAASRDLPRDWAIQVGAFGTAGQASEAAGSARSRVRGLLSDAHAEVAGIRGNKGGARVYRARLTGLSRNDAMQACQRLSHGRSECMVVSPDSRS